MNEEVYRCLALLWLSPADEERNETVRECGRILPTIAATDEEGGRLIGRFLEEKPVSEEEYVDLFELEPRCPLYLGSHVYEEPKTCAQAGVSDRNGYMIDLVGIYKHFGWAPAEGELPDYLPSLIEFLALTVTKREDPVRKKLINEYILPFLPPMRSKLEELKTPYLCLLDAFERFLNLDQEKDHVG